MCICIVRSSLVANFVVLCENPKCLATTWSNVSLHFLHRQPYLDVDGLVQLPDDHGILGRVIRTLVPQQVHAARQTVDALCQAITVGLDREKDQDAFAARSLSDLVDDRPMVQRATVIDAQLGKLRICRLLLQCLIQVLQKDCDRGSESRVVFPFMSPWLIISSFLVSLLNLY